VYGELHQYYGQHCPLSEVFDIHDISGVGSHLFRWLIVIILTNQLFFLFLILVVVIGI